MPPADAEEWTDEQWLEWLSETDELFPAQVETPPPRRGISGSRTGNLLGNAMVGVANALYGRKDNEVVIVGEAPGPLGDEELEVHLDPDDPEKSEVIVRRRPQADD